jgi:riboflavin kinase
LEAVNIKGEVITGRGEGERFIKLPWVKRQIAEKLGFAPFHGTLNIRLSEQDTKLRKQLGKANSINIQPVASFSPGRCYKAYLPSNIECAIVVPEVPKYPADIIEIVAAINLREKLQLKDGDVVNIKIPI